MSEKTLKIDNIEVSKKKFISLNNQLISIQQTQKKQLDLTDLSLVMMVLSILLATKKITQLDFYFASNDWVHKIF